MSFIVVPKSPTFTIIILHSDFKHLLKKNVTKRKTISFQTKFVASCYKWCHACPTISAYTLHAQDSRTFAKRNKKRKEKICCNRFEAYVYNATESNGLIHRNYYYV